MAKREPLWLQPAALIGYGGGPYGTRLQPAIPLAHCERAPGLRWAAWAQAIAACYLAKAAWRKPVGMWLARLTTPFTSLREVIHGQPIALAGERALRWPTMATHRPRGGRSAAISTSIVVHHPTPEGALTRLPARQTRGAVHTRVTLPMVVYHPAREGALTRLRLRQAQETIQTDVIVRRLLARGTRIEGPGHPSLSHRRSQGVSTARHDGGSEGAGEPMARPEPATRLPAMVLRRPRHVPQKHETSDWERAQGVEAHLASPLTPARNTLAQGPPQTPPIDVNGLTDQVIQTLDRRLTAWRERMGRM